mmetsp:Transcript_27963/g.58226  ORF Transcript_27963/g.58226 Transcript_27963/m.58226 type:complete len:262 (+) Transcript_27963:939-1724(+)
MARLRSTARTRGARDLGRRRGGGCERARDGRLAVITADCREAASPVETRRECRHRSTWPISLSWKPRVQKRTARLRSPRRRRMPMGLQTCRKRRTLRPLPAETPMSQGLILRLLPRRVCLNHRFQLLQRPRSRTHRWLWRLLLPLPLPLLPRALLFLRLRRLQWQPSLRSNLMLLDVWLADSPCGRWQRMTGRPNAAIRVLTCDTCRGTWPWLDCSALSIILGLKASCLVSAKNVAVKHEEHPMRRKLVLIQVQGAEVTGS